MEAVVVGNSLMIAVDKRDKGIPILEWLKADLVLPESYVASLFRSGRVLVGDKVVSPEHIVEPGQRVRLVGDVHEPVGIELPNRALPPLDVLYEDDHALIVNKPAGLLVYPGEPEDRDTLAHRVAAYFDSLGLERKVRHVHRLDRDTTGAVLYAKHAYSARTFDDMLASHRIARTYVAVVQGRMRPPHGVIDAGIGRDRHVAGRYRVSATGKPARTYYRTLMAARGQGKTASLIACRLETGRTHQIRVHLAHAGAPVVGDSVYRSGHNMASLSWPTGYALHAVSLAFWHPYLERDVMVSAPVPELFRTGMESLGFGEHWEEEVEKAGRMTRFVQTQEVED